MKQERQKYWNEEVVGMDKLERRNYLKQIYATFNQEQFEKVKVYISHLVIFDIYCNSWNSCLHGLLEFLLELCKRKSSRFKRTNTRIK